MESVHDAALRKLTVCAPPHHALMSSVVEAHDTLLHEYYPRLVEHGALNRWLVRTPIIGEDGTPVMAENGKPACHITTMREQITNFRFGRPLDLEPSTKEWKTYSTIGRCRARNGTYYANCYGDIVMSRYDTESKAWVPVNTQKDVVLFPHYVMSGSSGDNALFFEGGASQPYDEQSGVFTVRGSAKHIPAQPSIAWNMELLLNKGDEDAIMYSWEMRSIHPDRVSKSTSTLKMFYMKPPVRFTKSGGSKLDNYQPIMAKLQYVDKAVPVMVALYGLGLSTTAIEWVLRSTCLSGWTDQYRDFCRDLMAICPCAPNKDAAILYMCRYRKARVDPRRFVPSRKKREDTKNEAMAFEQVPADAVPAEPTPEMKTNTYKIRSFQRSILDSETLPHASDYARPAESSAEKALIIATGIWRLYAVSRGIVGADNRDHSTFKRRHVDAILTANLIRQMLNAQITYQQRNKYAAVNSGMDAPPMNINHVSIAMQLSANYKNGQWIAKKNQANKNPKQNVVQTLDSTNIWHLLSSLAKLMSSVLRKTPNGSAARSADPMDPGRLDAETPEDAKCGQVRCRAPYCRFSIGSSPTVLMTILEQDAERLDIILVRNWEVEVMQHRTSRIEKRTQIRVYGRLMGWIPGANVPALVELVRQHRRLLNIEPDTEIGLRPGLGSNCGIVDILTDPGRLIRPLVVAERYDDFEYLIRSGHSHVGLHDLVAEGIVEYIGPQEEATLCRIALCKPPSRNIREGQPATTHVEIHMAMALGINMGINPHPQDNQSARNVFASSMSKHAIALHQNPILKKQKIHYTLCYAQRPLVNTYIARSLPVDTGLDGINAIVAVIPWDGFNVEDSIVIRASFLQFGAGISAQSETFIDAESKTTNTSARENYKVPNRDTCAIMKYANYDKLDPETAMPPKGTIVCRGDVIIGKTTTVKVAGSTLAEQEGKMVMAEKCASLVYQGESGIVTDAVVTHLQGRQMRTVTVQCVKQVVIGNKWKSRNGQKGVIGLIVPDDQFPFNEQTGMMPDICINPAGFASRMTKSQQDETVQAKALLVESWEKDLPDSKANMLKVVREKATDQKRSKDAETLLTHIRKKVTEDATAWRHTKKEDLLDACEVLFEAGLSTRRGHPATERLCNGCTGTRIECPIFMGPVHYSALKQMAAGKEHHRSTGPVNTTTRQPTDGHTGGIRFGNMEGDAAKGYGCAEMLRENQMMLSDAFTSSHCIKCGRFAVVNWNKRYSECRSCGSFGTVYIVRKPYVVKLSEQEQMSMGYEQILELEPTGEFVTSKSRRFPRA